MIKYNSEKIRCIDLSIILKDLILHIWDMNQQLPSGRHKVAFRLTLGENVLYETENCSLSQYQSIDGDHSVCDILGMFKCPEIDQESIINNFVNNHCDEISLWLEILADENCFQSRKNNNLYYEDHYNCTYEEFKSKFELKDLEFESDEQFQKNNL